MGQSPRAEDAAWRRSLHAALRSAQKGNGPVRLAVLGIGNELSADDGAGVYVARALHVRWGPRQDCLVLEAATAPESFGGPLRRFRPDLVLLVDAVQMDAPAGTVAWIEWEQVDGLSASTHTLPPSTLAIYLMSELRCQVALLGIQIARLDFGQPLSAPVQQAVEAVVEGLVHLLPPD
jgi:hydrogenase 3 maturation protease